MSESLQILIADDHALFRKGFALLLQDSLANSKIIEASGFDAALDIALGVGNGLAMLAGEQFSHCGVDAFQLAKYQEGWKVVTLADTRQREGCPKRDG